MDHTWLSKPVAQHASDARTASFCDHGILPWFDAHQRRDTGRDAEKFFQSNATLLTLKYPDWTQKASEAPLTATDRVCVARGSRSPSAGCGCLEGVFTTNLHVCRLAYRRRSRPLTRDPDSLTQTL